MLITPPANLWFQFHNGAIKRLKPNGIWLIFCKFQFHNGAIKRSNGTTLVNSSILFQFHNGAIKRISIRIH